MTIPTPSEYAAIGRRVAAMRHHALGNGGCLSDRAALWELCERLMEAAWIEGPTGVDARWWIRGDPFPSREAAVAALLESLGGTDG